jgi:GT2 family glycosyltransferase
VIPAGQTLSFATYFNSFSLGKWRKYSTLSALRLRVVTQGDFVLGVHHVRQEGEDLRDALLSTHAAASAVPVPHDFPLPLDADDGLLYFTVTAAEEDVLFFTGEYYTPQAATQNVTLAVNICTYRRETFVAHNIHLLIEELLDNDNAPLHGHLQIFIADNGQSVDETSIAHAAVHVFPNRNLGGAGGFGRGMLEILDQRETLGITHILMMDDDVVLDPQVLVRTYCFLCYLKPEYAHAFLGGAMLSLQERFTQVEAADYYDEVRHHPIKPRYDLRELTHVLDNEREEPINYFSWWYCCMPAGVLRADNLPLPIFIKRDDIEYGLRNGTQFITINGIGVWHEEFALKRSSFLEYYYLRNMCILNALHRPKFGTAALLYFLLRALLRSLAEFRYAEAQLKLAAVEDFCKGVDWLMAQDAEKLHSAVMAAAYAKVPLAEEEIRYIRARVLTDDEEESTAGRVGRTLLLNGWFLLAKRQIVVVPAVKPARRLFFRAKYVVNYEETTQTAFATKRRLFSLLRVLARLGAFCLHSLPRAARVAQEYRSRAAELTSRAYWEQHLYQPGEADDSNKKPLTYGFYQQ